ncbi:3-hydroxyacyl-CoA dehydrogenase NAD-binding domain-containing protein [Pseudosulfitobacter pseudonitzschiae]|uniref:3-hydroxyacyl-CoA dehydrogenase NAD-binding domain-containing protein n=1 Tax=Pseudosulfitobacter pseudonitzschiae TaxID=1402135 RepID=UPI001AF3E18C|nr:3-hydroxyacyl-CoA dehydrogenase NAD-binding domain-containing protein [Pseudosulfitobacter pseudonitzschiae]MBM1817570.1 3-hydroxyacyl-CoA dehydrogenase [Pseudosulfitobacter pseudonitzschiae]MBM1834481.1 3-hydroxyacyl-CoA dehydrogenase [Pseudosulfitobacter pseudonitzschiae]MBM1839346.1 3-hydroxyacyl-CoA dehydrogenase [Pseudosulfitobacter pseudonitzschiae]MBM1844196.1 3-hydroxyacyl-CoA dehydrogenase [Pseudosulfitobacter pseudonitzschiae]MBM1849031.1 3-hydroxyacyl-CoA dehydrogenase [Pseudosul
MTTDAPPPRIAILGAGLIGAAWAALFQHHGADVRVWDPQADALAATPTRMTKPLAQLAEAAPDAGPLGSLTLCDTLTEAVTGADLVQENAPENIPVKHDLYAQVEPLLADHAVLASSTSALTWSELAPGLQDPARLITAHPFNPPHLVPLVEIYGTDADRIAQAEALYRGAGRVPVRLNKDATGHIANRLASALWREAVFMVQDGIADVEAIDAALVNGPGLRWSVLGAHMAYHLGGGTGGMQGYLAHLGPSQERRWAALGSPTLSPEVQAELVAGVTREATGRDIAELEDTRDKALIAALRARKDAPHV